MLSVRDIIQLPIYQFISFLHFAWIYIYRADIKVGEMHNEKEKARLEWRNFGLYQKFAAQDTILSQEPLPSFPPWNISYIFLNQWAQNIPDNEVWYIALWLRNGLE